MNNRELLDALWRARIRRVVRRHINAGTKAQNLIPATIASLTQTRRAKMAVIKRDVRADVYAVFKMMTAEGEFEGVALGVIHDAPIGELKPFKP